MVFLSSFGGSLRTRNWTRVNWFGQPWAIAMWRFAWRASSARSWRESPVFFSFFVETSKTPLMASFDIFWSAEFHACSNKFSTKLLTNKLLIIKFSTGGPKTKGQLVTTEVVASIQLTQSDQKSKGAVGSGWIVGSSEAKSKLGVQMFFPSRSRGLDMTQLETRMPSRIMSSDVMVLRCSGIWAELAKWRPGNGWSQAAVQQGIRCR